MASVWRHPDTEPEENLALTRRALGDRAPEPVVQFIGLLVRKHRMTEWSAIVDTFEQQYRAAHKLERALVRSARPIAPELLERLDAYLERWRGSSIDVVTEIDPTLLGGVQVRIGSLLIDGSLRSRITALAQQLTATPVV